MEIKRGGERTFAGKEICLKPFWAYYGGKWRAAPRYPKPIYDTIIEPFAGAAGYSLRHFEKNIILIEKYKVIYEIWKYLTSTSHDEILKIPYVEHINDLPEWVPQGARYLVGFLLNSGTATPCNQLSAGVKRLRLMGRSCQGWTEKYRERIARQVPLIKHWKIIEGNYKDIENIEATWFIDAPYNNKAGRYYKLHDLNYEELGYWCKTRKGQVIVCENDGADWLPFKEFHKIKSGPKTKISNEVMWYNEN